MSEQVEWNENSRFKKHDPQVVYAELERIRVKHGTLTPEIIVDESRRKSSPIHAIVYEMSDEEAARAGRLEVARLLVRHLVVRIIVPEGAGKTFTVRPLISHRLPDGRREYVNMQQAMEDKETRADIVAQALEELRSFRKKYAAYSELARVFGAIDEELAAAQ